MYIGLLSIHSITRWLVVIFGGLAFFFALFGLLGGRRWKKIDDRLGMMFASFYDLQLLLGLLLYFFASPITKGAWRDMGTLMADATMRYFGVEHSLMLLLGLVFVHIGRSQTRKAGEEKKKFRLVVLWFGLALAFIVIAVPWPISGMPRPWLRLFGIVF